MTVDTNAPLQTLGKKGKHVFVLKQFQGKKFWEYAPSAGIDIELIVNNIDLPEIVDDMELYRRKEE